MINILIINLYKDNCYQENLSENLEYYNISHDHISYDMFDSIDFSKYSHFILTGSDFFTLENEIALSKEQIFTLLSTKKPILAQCYGFHLLVYHLVSNKAIKLFKKKDYGFVKVNSPLTNPNQDYLLNHYNYIKYLDDNWDIISTRKMRDLDGRNKEFIVDAKLKEFDVLVLQYHPEVKKETYSFLYDWIHKKL